MKKIKVVLNPVAGRGYSAKAETDICRFFEEEKVEFELQRTERTWHAAEIAEEAVTNGFDTVVAAGGDGTTNEVINGLMAAKNNGHPGGMLALLATGSGSDFTFNVGMPSDLQEACRRIAKGQAKVVDLGKLTLDDQPPRYFDNQMGIGFDGVVTVEARKFKRLRGMALYLPVVLKSIFVSNKATRVTVDYDGEKLELSTIQISIANGAREGGGFFMTPGAKIDDGLFDICIVEEVGKLEMLKLVPHFMKGTHVEQDCTRVLQAKKVVIESEDNLIAHFDGELLCTEGHRIECEIIPQSLRVIY
ncbi:YegS/Rv2252/BmrU family lipid kinase [candidate division KSB1 bacterium]|nr:YegS/Rv2252/BmrU family lipid kinase [candidate division KSB1 bacterium]